MSENKQDQYTNETARKVGRAIAIVGMGAVCLLLALIFAIALAGAWQILMGIVAL